MSRSDGEHNYRLFLNWVDERRKCGDWNNYVRGSQLNRTEIANDCGFSRNVFKRGKLGNKAIYDELENLEQELHEMQILKNKGIASVQDVISSIELKVSLKAKRINELEAEVALLKAKNEKLECMFAHLKDTGMILR